MLALDLETGEKRFETLMDETNPETGNNIQEKLQVLQMPVGFARYSLNRRQTSLHEVSEVRLRGESIRDRTQLGRLCDPGIQATR